MISRNNRSRRARKYDDSDPLDRDYGYGYSEEGRPITGIVDEGLDNLDAPIFDAKGETIHVNMAQRPAIRVCATGHDLVPDPSETEFEAETCSRCPYGRLLRRK